MEANGCLAVWIAEVAFDQDVGAELAETDALERKIWRWREVRERDAGVSGEFWSKEECGFVDEFAGERGAIERGAGFEQHATDFPARQVLARTTSTPAFWSFRAFGESSFACVKMTRSSSAVFTMRLAAGMRSLESRVTRRRRRRRSRPLRSVRKGSSAMMVPTPVRSASDAWRMRWTSARDSSEVTQARFGWRDLAGLGFSRAS